MILLALVLLEHLNNAFERQDPIEARLCGFHSRRKTFYGREHCLENGFVYAHHRDDAHAIDSEGGVNRAARQRLSDAVARCQFDGIPSGWQAQAQIKPLAIDRLDFPAPVVGAAHAVTSREAGHAGQRHGWTMAYCAVPAALPLALRLLRAAGEAPAGTVGEARVAAGPCASAGAVSTFCSCSIIRSRATFFWCWS
jgi:hypothetical protein